MLADIFTVDNIYIVCGVTDMRKSIDGLCASVQDKLWMDPRQSTLYLFCGRSRDRFKALLWEEDGFVLIYKRLAARGKFQWPKDASEVRNLMERVRLADVMRRYRAAKGDQRAGVIWVFLLCSFLKSMIRP